MLNNSIILWHWRRSLLKHNEIWHCYKYTHSYVAIFYHITISKYLYCILQLKMNNKTSCLPTLTNLYDWLLRIYSSDVYWFNVELMYTFVWTHLHWFSAIFSLSEYFAPSGNWVVVILTMWTIFCTCN